MIPVVIAENPLDPRDWERHDVPDLRDFLMERFEEWPDLARVYDLTGFQDVERAAGAAMTTVLANRDVTPHDEAGVERLGQLEGPVLVVLAPADPLTAIITVVAVVLAVAATLLLMPKLPEVNNQYKSPNNALSDRKNTARPSGRIPDIFGQVRSTPDLLAVPYKFFEDNLEIEIAYMCVGRGAYVIDDVKDGDTPLTELAGAGATFYGPDTSPNSGAPLLTIGTAIPDPVRASFKVDEVNEQTLKPTNYGTVKGNASIRFTSPNLIETNDGTLDFTEHFEGGDTLIVSNADFSGGTALLNPITQNARFYPDGKVEFQSFDPTTIYAVGMDLIIANAGYAGLDGTGAVVYIDVSGTYPILEVHPTYMMLDIT